MGLDLARPPRAAHRRVGRDRAGDRPRPSRPGRHGDRHRAPDGGAGAARAASSGTGWRRCPPTSPTMKTWRPCRAAPGRWTCWWPTPALPGSGQPHQLRGDRHRPGAGREPARAASARARAAAGDGRARRGPRGLRLLAVGQDRQSRVRPLLGVEVRLAGAAHALREDLVGTGVGVTVVFPGFIRDAGMFHDSGASLPRGVGTRTPEQVAEALVRGIEKGRLEVDVAPLSLRLGPRPRGWRRPRWARFSGGWEAPRSRARWPGARPTSAGARAPAGGRGRRRCPDRGSRRRSPPAGRPSRRA